MVRGLRVVFSPNPVSRVLYSYRVPEPGTRGTVTAARTPSVAGSPPPRVVDVVTPAAAFDPAGHLREEPPHLRNYLRRSDALEYAPDVDPAAARELASQGIATVGDFLALSPVALEQRLTRLHAPSETIRRWQGHTGPLHPSPLFGGNNKDNWLKGHLIHCAHHLSFLIPRQA